MFKKLRGLLTPLALLAIATTAHSCCPTGYSSCGEAKTAATEECGSYEDGREITAFECFQDPTTGCVTVLWICEMVAEIPGGPTLPPIFGGPIE